MPETDNIGSSSGRTRERVILTLRLKELIDHFVIFALFGVNKRRDALEMDAKGCC